MILRRAEALTFGTERGIHEELADDFYSGCGPRILRDDGRGSVQGMNLVLGFGVLIILESFRRAAKVWETEL